MIPVLSREQIRAFDRHAIEERGVPSLLLMENAGRGAADVVRRAIQAHGDRVVIVAGPGNNGGDAFVVARRLVTQGHAPGVFLTCESDRLKGDARTNHDAYVAVGGTVVASALDAGRASLAAALADADVAVDGLLGTGLDRDVTGELAALIDELNAAGAHRVAVDIPSGLCANTGRVLGTAVRADETVTFAHPKLGLFTPGGADHVGRLSVVDIGVPSGFVDAVGHRAEILEASDVAARLPARPASAHKGRSGRVVVIAGSPGKTGAALLSARGALRAGGGLVTLVSFGEVARELDKRVLEAMTAAVDEARLAEDVDAAIAAADAVVIGPGIGLDARARRLVDHVVLRYPGRKVVDADALTHLGGRLGELADAPGQLLLTPHPGEMARLLGTDTGAVEADRFAAVEQAVERSGAAVLLKGAHTVIGGPDRPLRINRTGNAALAVGGAGDVLSGICGALMVGASEPAEVGAVAAYLHGRAADRWASLAGADRGMLAREIADGLPGALAELRVARGLAGVS
jgi:NAD(P)H-hydrate epimerase